MFSFAKSLRDQELASTHLMSSTLTWASSWGLISKTSARLDDLIDIQQTLRVVPINYFMFQLKAECSFGVTPNWGQHSFERILIVHFINSFFFPDFNWTGYALIYEDNITDRPNCILVPKVRVYKLFSGVGEHGLHSIQYWSRKCCSPSNMKGMCRKYT